MCLKTDDWPSNGTSCCYNHYHNGSACVPCPPGSYGQDCDKKCSNGSYGHLCSAKCQCPLEFCSQVTGCSADYSSSSMSHISTSNTYASKHFASINTEITKTSHVPRLIFSTSTISLTTDNPISTDNHNSIDVNIFIMSICGVTVLFLSILIILLCIKRSKHKHNGKQVFSQQIEGQVEEEYYDEINESVIAERGYDDISERLQLEKYSGLQTYSNSTAAVPYEKINHQLTNRERTDSLVISSTSSKSYTSNKSYLIPKSNIYGEHSYLDGMDSSPENEVTLLQSNLIQLGDNSDPNSSFLYTDPIDDVHSDKNILRSFDLCDDNNTYLDVTNETTL